MGPKGINSSLICWLYIIHMIPLMDISCAVGIWKDKLFERIPDARIGMTAVVTSSCPSDNHAMVLELCLAMADCSAVEINIDTSMCRYFTMCSSLRHIESNSSSLHLWKDTGLNKVYFYIFSTDC